MQNNGLKELQRKKREESIEQVEWALNYFRDLEGEYCRITAVKIADVTGLSRATLYKQHLRPLWDSNWNKIERTENEQLDTNNFYQELEKLQNEVVFLKNIIEKNKDEILRLEKGLENEKSRSKVYKQDYEELKERYQQLLHHNLRILRKLHLHGIDVKDLELEKDN